MALFYISDSNWKIFLQSLSKMHSVYALGSEDGSLLWEQLSPENIDGITISLYRSSHPIKAFFFPAREEVTEEPSARKTLLLGVKSCDIEHLKIMDAVFAGPDLKDPYYVRKRQNTVFVSSDCTAALPSCFCTKMSVNPFPEKGFDINLSHVRAGYVAETGSKNGDDLVTARRHLFQDPQPYHLKEREQSRQRMLTALETQNSAFTWKDPKHVVETSFASPAWKDKVAARCVECDACRFACGTCYCFILGESQKSWSRIRSWDSCQSSGYSRVAGGGNPRKTKTERLRNLYACKLVNRRQSLGLYACTGCGRCVEACQGKIDIRESLQTLSNGGDK